MEATIPLDNFASELIVTVPISFDIPTNNDVEEKLSSNSGRSFSSSLKSHRSNFYKQIEKYMGQMTGADGHACLLRAMCEASSHPLHDEGLLGDAVNFLLTANYAAEESDEKFKKYLGAQTKGQVSISIKNVFRRRKPT